MRLEVIESFKRLDKAHSRLGEIADSMPIGSKERSEAIKEMRQNLEIKTGEFIREWHGK